MRVLNLQDSVRQSAIWWTNPSSFLYHLLPIPPPTVPPPERRERDARDELVAKMATRCSGRLDSMSRLLNCEHSNGHLKIRVLKLNDSATHSRRVCKKPVRVFLLMRFFNPNEYIALEKPVALAVHFRFGWPCHYNRRKLEKS